MYIITMSVPMEQQTVSQSQNMQEESGEFHIGHLTFTAGGSLKLHTNDNTVEKPHRCLICEAECMKPSHQSLQSRSYSVNRLYDCSVCHGKFSRKSNLKLHMKLHAIKKEYECKVCNIKFPHRKILKGHRTRHSKKYSCFLCSARFATTMDLCNHEETHAYKCVVCGIKLLQQSDIFTHLKFHTEEKPYECTICGVKFVQRPALLLHLKVHTLESQFKCATHYPSGKMCPTDTFSKIQKTYKNPFMYMSLKKPDGNVEDLREHECGNCNAKFLTRDALVKHELEHRDLKHECAMCAEGFSSLERLNIHKDAHIEIPLELKDLSLNAR